MLRRGSFWINSNGTIIKEGNVFITYEGKCVLVGTILVGVRFTGDAVEYMRVMC